MLDGIRCSLQTKGTGSRRQRHVSRSALFDSLDQIVVGFPDHVPKLVYLCRRLLAHGALYQKRDAVDKNQWEDGDADETYSQDHKKLMTNKLTHDR
jgi:hypothetical protein